MRKSKLGEKDRIRLGYSRKAWKKFKRKAYKARRNIQKKKTLFDYFDRWKLEVYDYHVYPEVLPMLYFKAERTWYRDKWVYSLDGGKTYMNPIVKTRKVDHDLRDMYEAYVEGWNISKDNEQHTFKQFETWYNSKYKHNG